MINPGSFSEDSLRNILIKSIMNLANGSSENEPILYYLPFPVLCLGSVQ